MARTRSTKSKRPSTLNRGADDDRAAIKAFIKRLLDRPAVRAFSGNVTPIKPTTELIKIWNGDRFINANRLLKFIKGMAKRADNKSGGRGKR